MNFENNIKEKLESRSMKPTASAWDRIESKLEVEQGRKKSKVVLWVGIAASFIAGVFITTFLLNTPSAREVNGGFVTVPESQKSVEGIVTPAPQVIATLENEVVEVTSQETISKKEKETTNRITTEVQQAAKKYERITMPLSGTQVAEVGNDQTIKKNTPEEFLEMAVDQKINEVVASVDLKTITDQEVDELLKKAQREIISDRAFDTQSTKVTANSLLLDVEAEVDPDTFKDKIFNTLKSGFNKAVDAVANKDN